jgi:ketosteroid isomerase-like protein
MKNVSVVSRWLGFAALLVWLGGGGVRAQDTSKDADRAALRATVAGLDTKLFDAYNTCDVKTLGAMVSDDLEFYHDQTGLAVGRQVFVESIKNNICGKLTRQLVPGTLEVYPLKNYGAVEMGVHRFYHPGEPGNVGEARFVHLWRYKDGVWQVTRVVSYEHGQAK